MTGTLINTGTVIFGSTLGLIIHKRMPERILSITFQGIGLFTIFLGIQMSLKINNLMVMIFSLLIGSILGEVLKLENRMDNFADKLKNKLKLKHEKFNEGIVTAFLLFCMGSMTLLGAIEEGLGNSPKLLLTKSVLDGFASIALASSLGIGVLFSVIPLLIFQGSITLFAGAFQDVLSPALIQEMTAVGGLMILGLGISILEIKKLRILNMLPAIPVSVGLYYLVKLIG